MQIPLTDPTDAGNKPGDGPLRVGGQGMPTSTTEANLPSTRSRASESQLEAAELARDCAGGQDLISAKGQKYLPKAPGETQDNYRIRLARSVFFNAYGRTVDGLTGLIFRKDPQLGEDVPERIVENWENIDLEGTHGDVFLRDLEADALTVGHNAILVDFPDVTGLRVTREDEREVIRPYWVPIRKEDIISWREVVEFGRKVLQQVVLEERIEAPVGEYGQKEVTVYRVIWRERGSDEFGGETITIRWKTLHVSKNKKVFQMGEGIYGNQIEIPISEVPTSGRLARFVSTPPLIDVAHLNVAHYQMWSDYATAIHKCNVPVFYALGFPVKDDNGKAVEYVIGANTVVASPDPSAKVGYASHDGAALGSTKSALDDLKSEMGTLGLAMLSPQKRAAETAEAKRLDKSTSDSALSVSARGLQDAVERALGFHARYLGLTEKGAGGSITINRDFEGLLMDAPVMSAYAQLVNAGFPERAVLEALQKGGRIAEDADLDELEMQMMAGRAQEEEAAALDAD